MILQSPIVELVSPLPRDECMRRIRDNADEGFIGVLPVVGTFESTSFLLWRRLLLSNKYQTILAAELVELQNGKTLLACRFGIDPPGVVIGVAGLAVLLILVLSVAYIFESPRRGIEEALMVIGAPAAALGLLGFGYALGRYLARNDAQFLTEFLRETAQAVPDKNWSYVTRTGRPNSSQPD